MISNEFCEVTSFSVAVAVEKQRRFFCGQGVQLVHNSLFLYGWYCCGLVGVIAVILAAGKSTYRYVNTTVHVYTANVPLLLVCMYIS